MTASEHHPEATAAVRWMRFVSALTVAPALHVLVLIVVASGLLLWFGWWRSDAYLVLPQPVKLYDRQADGSLGEAQAGSVTWRFTTDAADGVSLVGHVAVPARGLDMTLSFRKNDDDSLPASHLIEVVQTDAPSAPGGQIANIDMPLAAPRAGDAMRPLLGATAKIDDGDFWIALSPLPQDVLDNLGLMRRAQAFLLPLTYASGQRGLLVVTKGPPGERLVRRALLAWARQ